MSVPMAIYALVTWVKHPYEGNHAEVKINKMRKKDFILLIPLTGAVTVAFYFILKYLGTSNLLVSTFSVSTSFSAVYLTSKRSPFYALAYALNDIVLIILWILASISDRSYVSVVACFSIFLLNDIYGFFNWLKMQKTQTK
jgi:nicotinamide mononucleotide transporter PnuC